MSFNKTINNNQLQQDEGIHNISFDYVKYVASICIVLLHVHLFDNLKPLYAKSLSVTFFTLAVPLFFVFTGYLFGKKTETLDEIKRFRYLIKYIKRLSIMYCFWSFVYLPISIRDIYIVTYKPWYSVLITYIINFFFKSSYMHLWYILFSIYSIVILYVLLYKIKASFRGLIPIVVMIYLCTIIFNSYGNILSGPFKEFIMSKYYSDRIIFSITYISIGMYFASLHDRKINMNIWVAFIALIPLYVIEVVVINVYGCSYFANQDMRFFLLPIILVIVISILNYPLKANAFNTKVALLMRKYSTLYYFLHMIVAIVMKQILLLIHLDKLYTNKLIFCVIILFVTHFSSSIYLKLLQCKTFRFLKSAI